MANDKKPLALKILNYTGGPYQAADRRDKGLPTKAEKDREKKGLKAQLAELEKQLAKERNKNFDLGRELADAIAEGKRLEEELFNSDRKLLQRANEVTNLKGQVETLKDQVEILKDQVGTLKDQEETQKGECNPLIDQLEALQTDLAEQRSKNDQQKDKITDLKRTLASKKFTIYDQEKALELQKTQISELENIRINQDAQISRLQSLLRPEDNEISRLNRLLTRQDDEISKLKSSQTSRDNEISKLEDSLKRREDEVSNLNFTLEDKKSKIFELNDTLVNKNAKIDDLEKTVKHKDDEIFALNGQLRELRRGGGRFPGSRAGSEDEYSPDPPMLSYYGAEYREWKPLMQEKAGSYRRAARRSEREVMEYIASWMEYPLSDEVNEAIPSFWKEEKLWDSLDRRFRFTPPSGRPGTGSRPRRR